MVAVLLVFIWCARREKRAAERRKRFEAFMAEEQGMLYGPKSSTPLPHSFRKLGPPAPEPGSSVAPSIDQRAMVDALGMSSTARSKPVAASAPVASCKVEMRNMVCKTGVPAAAPKVAASVEAEEDPASEAFETGEMHAAVREAVRLKACASSCALIPIIPLARALCQHLCRFGWISRSARHKGEQQPSRRAKRPSQKLVPVRSARRSSN